MPENCFHTFKQCRTYIVILASNRQDMNLIPSISGVRGTIGGIPGKALTPPDIIQYASAYADWLLKSNATPAVVIGRDGRLHGMMVQQLFMQTLIAKGIDVYDVGLSTTPTVEMMVPHLKTGGGVIISASHNPKEWNAFKFLNADGEFINAEDGEYIKDLVKKNQFTYCTTDQLGKLSVIDSAIDYHIQEVCNHPLVDPELIRSKKFHVIIDAINSTGAIAIPALCDALGCTWECINAEITGDFQHIAEPLPQHLTELATQVKNSHCDLGIAVDPDVDRLVLVCENGDMFGEEYTLVAVADYVLSQIPGNTVSNLSSTKALQDITEQYGHQYTASAVGEVNVVAKMKEVQAVIGGEGNGGIIVPDLHYGRDALIGVALILTALAKRNVSLSQLRATYPDYFMSKKSVKIQTTDDAKDILKAILNKYQDHPINTIDGVRIDIGSGWAHIRSSNTEPIIRVYTEQKTQKDADAIADKILKEIHEISNI